MTPIVESPKLLREISLNMSSLEADPGFFKLKKIPSSRILTKTAPKMKKMTRKSLELTPSSKILNRMVSKKHLCTQTLV